MRPPLIFGITIIGLAIVGGAGYAGYRTMQTDTASTPEPPKTIPVQRGDVKLTVTAPGQLAGIRSETFRSPAATTVLEISVRPGDQVRKNDVVARLDTAPLEEALNEAEEVVIDDRERIEAQVTAAEENLRQAEDTLSDLQLNYPSAERARLELRQAQDALSKARQANNKAKSAYESARKTRDNRKADLNAANKAVNKTQSAYDQVAANLASSLAAQASAQQNLTAAQANQAAAQAAYDQAVTNGDPQDVIDALFAALQTANQAADEAQAALDAADAAVQLAQQAANEAQAKLQAAQADWTTAQTRYNAADANYQSANTAYQQTQTTLNSADYSVKFAQLALDNLKTQQQSADIQIEAAKRAIGEARDDLADARAVTVDAGLTDAAEKARLALANATLHASFDGIVKEVNHQTGEAVNKDEALVTILDPGVLEVSSTVVEEDLPLVKIGQKADLFFDAAPDAVLTGEIDRIVPERAEGSDRTVYTVYIRVDGQLPEGLLPGMTADGSIIIEQSADVLVLPRALVRAGSNNTAIVEVWDGTERQQRTVRIGLRGDVNVEIAEGLHEGDLVVSE